MSSGERQRPPVHEKIARRRTALGLSESRVAELSGLSVHEYGDLEQHAAEAFEVLELRKLKCVCAAPELSLWNLLELECETCGGRSMRDALADGILPRNSLLRQSREKLGLPARELGDRVNITDERIENLERDPDLIEGLPIADIQALSRELRIPLQVLLGISCKTCGR